MAAGDEVRQHQMNIENIERNKMDLQGKKKNEMQEIDILQRRMKSHQDNVAQIDKSIADLDNRENSEKQAMQGAQNKQKIEQQKLDQQMKDLQAQQQKMAA